MGPIANCCTNRDEKTPNLNAKEGVDGDGAPPVAVVSTKDMMIDLHAKAKEHGSKHLENAKNYDYQKHVDAVKGHDYAGTLEKVKNHDYQGSLDKVKNHDYKASLEKAKSHPMVEKAKAHPMVGKIQEKIYGEVGEAKDGAN
jgi:hypothetical protein